MQINRKGKISLLSVWGIAIVCFASLSVLLISAFSLYDKISNDDLFKINSLVIPDYSQTDDGFRVMPINYEALKNNEHERDEFLKMLVKQYIVNRYTVNGRPQFMEENLGLNNLGNIGAGLVYGAKIKRPAIRGRNERGEVEFEDSYKDFLSGRDGERDEINNLLRDGTTRTVRIISEPKKVGDWMVTDVEFIYKTPTTYSLKDAKKEIYQISMVCRFAGLDFANMVRYDASSIFVFIVEYINKTKIQ